MRLSVLVPTMVHRQDRFLRLLAVLLPQAEQAPEPVEVAALRNRGERYLSEYRQALVDDARGEFVAFVDDDDLVPDYYVTEILTALADPEVDIIGFDQACTGLAAPLTSVSKNHAQAGHDPVPGPDGGLFYQRLTNHLCPVRATLARKARFSYGDGEINFGEDRAYALSLALEDAKEAYISKVMYTYRWSPADCSQMAMPPVLRYRLEHEFRLRPVIHSRCFRWHSWSV